MHTRVFSHYGNHQNETQDYICINEIAVVITEGMGGLSRAGSVETVLEEVLDHHSPEEVLDHIPEHQIKEISLELFDGDHGRKSELIKNISKHVDYKN